jgi:hypothetical protein
MHTRRTSKLARETRHEGHLRVKRTSIAEEETTKEKESMAEPAAEKKPTVRSKKMGRGTGRRTRTHSPESKADWPRGEEPRNS